MPHYLSYEKKSGAVTGYLKFSSEDINPVPRSDDEAYVMVSSPEHIDMVARLSPVASRLHVRIEGNELRSLKAEPAFAGSIVLSCDLPDLDGDGRPELPADGSGVAHIRAQLLGNDKKPVKVDGLRMDFRVTRGRLSHRQVTVHGAEAAVELHSAAETVATRITASASGFAAGVLTLEFVPAEEYKELQKSAKAPPSRKT
ncbi:hypothetical protein ACFJGW_18175 [Burkholderiaceae bacterium UC74_6]